MLQRLQIELAQVEAGNTSENVLNDCIKQKVLLKKVYSNIMNSM